MPYLRFFRDKRGYENTYVFHGSAVDGRSRPRLLYWFRTPPNVKVGRLSLDPAAIRAVEANNPEVRFDWNKMLKVRGTPKPGQRETGEPRARRGRRPAPKASVPAPEPEVPGVSPAPAEAPAVSPVPMESTSPVLTSGPESSPPLEPEAVAPVDADELAAKAHLESLADAEPILEETEEHPVVTLMGHETLVRLRARYAEIRARIDEKPLDPEQLDTIGTEAEKLNPDRWTKIEDAVAGIERFESEVEVLKAQLGRRPPRQRRDDS